MRKISFFIFLIITRLSSFGQAWAMHEAAEDAMETEPLSLKSLIAGVVLAVIIYVLYKWSKHIKNISYEKYQKLLKTITISAIAIAIGLFIIIKFYYSIKYNDLKDEAEERFSSLCEKTDVYFNYEPFPDNFVSCREMNPYYFDKQVGSNEYNYVYKYYYHNQQDDGVFNCFEITEHVCPTLEVIFAKEAKRRVGTMEPPALYEFSLQPYRIRYFSKNGNPQNDILNVFPSFYQSFCTRYTCSEIPEILDISKKPYLKALNEYFTIMSLTDGEELFDKNILREANLHFERVYWYETINYGDFEIIYGVFRLRKLGVQERYKDGNILGHSWYGKISEVELYSSYARFAMIYLSLLILLGIFLYIGKPNKKK